MEKILLSRGIEVLIVLSYVKVPAVIDFDFSKFSVSAIEKALTQPRLDAVGRDLKTDLSTVHSHDSLLYEHSDRNLSSSDPFAYTIHALAAFEGCES